MHRLPLPFGNIPVAPQDVSLSGHQIAHVHLWILLHNAPDIFRRDSVLRCPRQGEGRGAESDSLANLAQSLAEWRGEDYIWQMYRDSPPLIWQTAFLNKRIFKIPNCFYSALDDDIHFYIPKDSGQLDRIPRNWKALRSTAGNCLGDDDVDFSAPRLPHHKVQPPEQ